ncbi:MAG TPA: hypothetical protein VF503_11510 [Sphingobium sp.]|uniref:hypothetical protein n=1 Tax=Sphingobium sp. TaxID=1912891 RepID=UPI002ED3E2DC
MHKFDDQDGRNKKDALLGSLMLLAFGLSVLAFLVVIDRPQWFELRPASGVASAISQAASVHGSEGVLNAQP